MMEGYIDLTCEPMEKNCIGRMSYKRPVILYDNTTGELASFATSFTFSIHLGPTKSKGDGMAFFLSGYPSRLTPGSNHDMLGLTRKHTTPSGADRFLAVEFDTSVNHWDPTGSEDHIGIDLNSLDSVVTTMLPSYSLNGTMTATITFDNTTRTLEATLHFDDNDSLHDARVKAQLPRDLYSFLPHEVAVGFSASTGAYEELHQIHSWSFNSTMAARGATNSHLQERQVQDTKADRHCRALITGGAVILVLSLLLALWSILSWYRWKRTRDSFGKGSRLRRFKYRDLCIATERFSDTKKIGAGGFGVVYSGSLKDVQVAVKRIVKDSRGEFKDFLAELGSIGRTGHGNVVRLEGWCCSINNFMFWCSHRQNVKLFLVYELVPNGNLHQHLHERPEVLSWTKRKILQVWNSEGLMVGTKLPPPSMQPIHLAQRHQTRQHTPGLRIQRQVGRLRPLKSGARQPRHIAQDNQGCWHRRVPGPSVHEEHRGQVPPQLRRVQLRHRGAGDCARRK
uniref:Uncharacterized protein n=1 Tax=Avena sativa TaxID=4498 RepID=A0ACD5ZQ45_AVESA